MNTAALLAATSQQTGGFGWHSMAILLHILLLTYWLGTDLAVYYASRFITDPAVPLAGRNVAAKILHVVDMGPRICLVLFLPSGVSLMALDDFGRDAFAGWPLALIWIASLLWLGLVVADYRKQPERFAVLVNKTDFVVRTLLVIGLLAVAAYTVIATEPFGVTTSPAWLAGKVAAYAICIFGGLAIRVKFRPFTAAYAELQTTGSTPEIEARIDSSLRSTLPYVYLIWVMVLVAAFLGVVKPGSTAF